MKKKLKFRIGDWVFVSYVRVPEDEPPTGDRNSNVFVRVIKCKPILACWGQICGMRRLALGESHMGGWRGGDDPTYFVATKFTALWEVRFGLLNKPVLCAEEDFRLMIKKERWACVGHKPELPLIKQDWTYPNKWRDELRKEMKDWPRDAKGRWVRKAIQKEAKQRGEEGGT